MLVLGTFVLHHGLQVLRLVTVLIGHRLKAQSVQWTAVTGDKPITCYAYADTIENLCLDCDESEMKGGDEDG